MELRQKKSSTLNSQVIIIVSFSLSIETTSNQNAKSEALLSPRLGSQDSPGSPDTLPILPSSEYPQQNSFPGMAYLPPVDEIDNEIIDDFDRKKRIHVFRPLFVYRQEQIKKMRVQQQKEKERREKEKKKKEKEMAATSTKRPSVFTPTARPSYSQNYSPIYGGTYYPPSPYYTYRPTYSQPQPVYSYYYNDDVVPHHSIPYPQQPLYDTKYPTYIWSNYIPNDIRRQ